MTESKSFWRKTGEFILDSLGIFAVTLFSFGLVALTTYGGTLTGLFFDAEGICADTGCNADGLKRVLLDNLVMVIGFAILVLFLERIAVLVLVERPRQKRVAQERQQWQQELRESLVALEDGIKDRIDALEDGPGQCCFCRRRRNRRGTSSQRRLASNRGERDAG